MLLAVNSGHYWTLLPVRSINIRLVRAWRRAFTSWAGLRNSSVRIIEYEQDSVIMHLGVTMHLGVIMRLGYLMQDRGMIFRRAKLLAVFTLLLISELAWLAPKARAEEAAQQEKAPMYVVDMERVIAESIAGKAARNTMQEEVKKAERKLQLLKNEVEKLKSDAAKQVNVLSDAAIEERKEAIAKRERDLQRSIEDNREELAKKNDAEMGKVVKRIDEVIKELAESGKYPLIIEKDPRYVVYANSRFDITDVVIGALDSKSTSS